MSTLSEKRLKPKHPRARLLTVHDVLLDHGLVHGEVQIVEELRELLEVDGAAAVVVVPCLLVPMPQ